MPASIIIACYDQLEYTKKCVQSLLMCDTLQKHEYIFINNGSTDGTTEYLRGLSIPKKIIIENEKNLGVAPAWNQGIRASKEQFLLVLNNDTFVGCDIAEVLIKECLRGDGILGVQGARLDPKSFRWAMDTVYIDDPIHYIVGYCMLIPRSVAKIVGPFDERFKIAGSEDADYGLRVTKAGFRLKIVPGLLHRTFQHFGSRTLAGQRAFDPVKVMLKNCERMKEKWGELDGKTLNRQRHHPYQPTHGDGS